MRNCTRDEGRPFEVGNQVLISSHRTLLLSKAMVVNVAEKSERDFERGERKRTADDVSSRLDDAKTGGWDQLGGCTETAQAASGMEAARSGPARKKRSNFLASLMMLRASRMALIAR
jgi:hypothetical protein